MSNSIEPVFVNIMGVEYPVKGDFDQNYIHKIAADLDRRMQEMARHLSKKSIEKTAVLTALNLEAELVSSRERSKWLIDGINSRTQRIINRIDEALQDAS